MLRFKRNTFRLFQRYASTQTKIIKSATPVVQALNYRVGDKVLGYVVKQVEEIREVQLAAIRLVHENTGAQHLHIARDDKNNFFGISLMTTPRNSTGAPHILEHLSLCGSRNYPCRDPYFKMLNRSLSTFMNAYTGPDSTMYPFSTQNPKDFENLLKVYLDAVFFPCLREMDFKQEGWRLEHEDITNKESPLTLKGVVYNEMKGVFSDPSQLYARYLLNKLYPSDTYANSFGGDPIHIPELTWTELKNFHATHYHPSNSRFFTYGDLPLESHLEMIEGKVLRHFSKINVETTVQDETKWLKPREEQIECRLDPMAADPTKQTIISNSYLLNSITETQESFTLNLLGNLLMGGPNAPFYKSLIEPGIGSDYSPFSGYEGFLKQSFFSIGLREIQENDVDLVKNIIDSTFSNVIKEGFPKERIEGVLHNIELAIKHQTTSFGHSTFMGVNTIWNHGGDPLMALKINNHVEWFQKQMMDDPFYLQKKVEQYFKQNMHKLTLIMSPSEDYERKIKSEEQELLNSKISALNEVEKEVIFNKGIELDKYQKTVEDVSCLPTLHVEDIEKTTEHTLLQHENVENVPFQFCEQPTNGIVYFRALAKIPPLSEDLLMLLPLFSAIVTKMGAGQRDYKQFDQEAELKTGGLSASIHLSQNPSQPGLFEHNICYASHCLDKNVQSMMSLWSDVFNGLQLQDLDRLSQIIKMSASDLAQSISSAGHRYCMTNAQSSLSAYGFLQEKMSGLKQVMFMKELAEMDSYGDVIMKLSVLAEHLLGKDTLKCAVNLNADSMPTTLLTMTDFINSISHKAVTQDYAVQDAPHQVMPQKSHFVLPFNVNYLGKCVLTVPFNHKDYAGLQIAAKLLSSKFLHREIREKGGAYGGGARLTKGGAFLLYSYRDPNLTKTLDRFNDGIQWLVDGEHTLQDIDESKLGVFSEVDHPVSPGSKGSMQFFSGITDQMKQTYRERLFEVQKEAIASVAKKYLLQSSLSSVALIGPENEVSKDNTEWTLHKE